MSEIASFLLMGQSNMAGRGHIGEVPAIHNPHCFMTRNGRWQPMSEPINPDRAIFEGTFRSGVGLSASFADSYATLYNTDIGLIPCADGGTSIAQWMPGEVLYDHALFQAKLAMRTSTLKGILWHQGENDCTPEKLAVYKDKLITMLTSFRHDLGIADLPIVVGEISTSSYEDPTVIDPHAVTMNRLIAEVAAELPHCALVRCAELPLQDDRIHFSAASYRILGIRYREALETILQPRVSL